MITKDKRTVCDSCNKVIVGEVNTIVSVPGNWGKTRKSTHFHPTPLDCAEAVEPVKIYKARSMKQREDN